MAVIQTIRASNGVLVRIHDDCLLHGEEKRRAIEAQRRAAYEILKTKGDCYDGNDDQGSGR